MRKNLLQRWWNAEHAIVSSANESLLFSQFPVATQLPSRDAVKVSHSSLPADRFM
jgi:hypothetical protein